MKSSTLVIILLLIACGGLEVVSADDFTVEQLYAQKDNWAQTLLATRSNYLQRVSELQIANAVSLGDWYATSPIKSSSFDDLLFPERGVDLYSRDKNKKRQWRKRSAWVDGVVHELPGQERAATYLFRTITATHMTVLSVGIGSDDGVALWLNGELLLARNVARGAAPNQDMVDLPLETGENTLLMKIYNNGGGHGFYFALGTSSVFPLWQKLSREYHVEMVAVMGDYPGGTAQALISGENGLRQVPKMIEKALKGADRYADRLNAKYEVLKAQNVAHDDSRWLELYRECALTRDGIVALQGLNIEQLHLSVEHLMEAYPDSYKNGKRYIEQLDAIAESFPDIITGMIGNPGATTEEIAGIMNFQRELLLDNPLLDFDRLLLVIRGEGQLGLPQNWQGNCSLPRRGYDNEIALLDMDNPGGGLRTVCKPEEKRFVGDVDLHYEADKMLFSMPDDCDRWQIWEIGVDGSGLRQVTLGEEPDVDNYDACYLPDDRIIFGSTRIFQGIPCVGGGDTVANLFRMNNDGSNARRLCFDQDHNWCPTVANDGRVLFTRWEYSDTPHYFTRLLFSMNPDGTNQMEYYGSNSYWPNSMFYAQPIPEHPTKVVTIVSGHHGVPRMGELVLLEPAQGRKEAEGAAQRIPGYNESVDPIIVDQLVNDSWPRFLHPYPLSEEYFLVSCKPDPDSPWGIYLVDVFDNMLLLREEPGYALFEPVPLRKRSRPPVIPDRVNLEKDYAMVYLTDVYAGPGLQGVPRGTVKKLRLFSFQYAYPKMGGHIQVGVEGPWDVRRILGTVPVFEDGSAYFKVPANTPIAVQPLDAENKSLQVMRSWFTAMPGEVLSCVGCHESQNMSPPPQNTLAVRHVPDEIAPWYGKTRGFSFHHEVQPVLDRYCVGCHNPEKTEIDARPDFTHHEERGWSNFNKSYLALHPYVRRPGPESDYHVPVPLEWHADTSELIQMLQKGHKGVKLDDEAWDRLVTWIDLNVPDHGRWTDHREIRSDFEKRRAEMQSLYACLPDDPSEEELVVADYPCDFIKPTPPKFDKTVPELEGWPFTPEEAMARQAASGSEIQRTIDLGNGVRMDFVLIPAGEFVMGGTACSDESPMTVVQIKKPFWMGKTEVTNQQYSRFDSLHDSRYIDQHHKDHTTPGYPANEPEQPVIRITWHDALGFCEWLSEVHGIQATLPSEAQWEWACRAGSDDDMYYGTLDTDFSTCANLADVSMRLLAVTGVNPQPIPNPNSFQNFLPQDARFDDGERIVTAVGQYNPNGWGLYDMHGNVSEWTLTSSQPYPYKADDGRNDRENSSRKVVRGGSWNDRPMRARAAFRLPYQPWQGVFNVGFRILISCAEDDVQKQVKVEKQIKY
ncbi:MAG: SUMF1/EgtB/PvdO family nonheme iron enzyme [Candidatus Hydrogenedentes bacterium]|nr:SUMF1/EgtB/PvdO family nonheme iron enzyme [Candidatus Hydrogenedentota bacterium]